MSKDINFVIYLVDDDQGVLKALTRLLSGQGYEVQAFSSPTQFLLHHDPSVPGCAIFDVSMPGLDGIELQSALRAGGVERPVIFITGVGDIPTTVRAMKDGAVDFLTKPVRAQELLAALSTAFDREVRALGHRQELAALTSRLSSLTERENEVLTHVIAGQLNKQIAGDLGVTEKTVKLHRRNLMLKMGVRSVAELVRITERAGVRPWLRAE